MNLVTASAELIERLASSLENASRTYCSDGHIGPWKTCEAPICRGDRTLIAEARAALDPAITLVQQGDMQRLHCRCTWVGPLMAAGHHLTDRMAKAHERTCPLNPVVALNAEAGESRG